MVNKIRWIKPEIGKIHPRTEGSKVSVGGILLDVKSWSDQMGAQLWLLEIHLDQNISERSSPFRFVGRGKWGLEWGGWGWFGGRTNVNQAVQMVVIGWDLFIWTNLDKLILAPGISTRLILPPSRSDLRDEFLCLGFVRTRDRRTGTVPDPCCSILDHRRQVGQYFLRPRGSVQDGTAGGRGSLQDGTAELLVPFLYEPRQSLERILIQLRTQRTSSPESLEFK